MKIATVKSDDGSELANNPGTVTMKNTGNAATLLLEQLMKRQTSAAVIPTTQPHVVQVKFSYYHDAAIVAKYINENTKI